MVFKTNYQEEIWSASRIVYNYVPHLKENERQYNSVTWAEITENIIENIKIGFIKCVV